MPQTRGQRRARKKQQASAKATVESKLTQKEEKNNPQIESDLHKLASISDIVKFSDSYKETLSLDQLERFLIKLIDLEFNKQTISNQLGLKLYDAIKSTLKRHVADESYSKIAIEIFWRMADLKLTLTIHHFNISEIKQLFIPLMLKNPLAYLHLCVNVDCTATYLRETDYNPFDHLKKALRNLNIVHFSKLLNSIALLGYNKKDMGPAMVHQLLCAIPEKLNRVTPSEKGKFLRSILWFLARFNFDFEDLENKDKSILSDIYQSFIDCQHDIDYSGYAILLWSLSVIQVPDTHPLCKSAIKNAVPLFNKLLFFEVESARQILESQYIYHFELNSDCRQKLQEAIDLEAKPDSSFFQIMLDKVVLKLLDEQRKQEPTLPIIPEPEVKIPIGEILYIWADRLLPPYFVIEYDGKKHEDRAAQDKLKNLFYRSTDYIVNRVNDEEVFGLNEKQLEEYFMQKIIYPYLDHFRRHQNPVKSSSISEAKKNSSLTDEDELPILAPHGKLSTVAFFSDPVKPSLKDDNKTTKDLTCARIPHIPLKRY